MLAAAGLLFAQEPLPTPWTHQDIGPAQVPGTARYAGGGFILQGTMDIWGTNDGAHFAFQPWHGDVELVACVTAIDNPGGMAHAKAGLCLRESTAAGSRHVTLCDTAADGVEFLCRDQTGGKTTHIFADAETLKTSVPKAHFPCWLKIVRRGNELTGYESVDGEKWQVSGRITLDLAADTVIGLVASSHQTNILNTATFDHVTLSQPPKIASPHLR